MDGRPRLLSTLMTPSRQRPDALNFDTSHSLLPGRKRIIVNLQPRSPDLRTTIDPQLSNAVPQSSPVDQEKDVFSALKRIPDLLRPEPPMPIGEAPRPPMPVVTASPKREFGN